MGRDTGWRLGTGLLSQHGEALREKTGTEVISIVISQAQLDASKPCTVPAPSADSGERKWYAVFTVPQNEKSAMKQLELREVEAFLPTYETFKIWKNRQRVKTILPLFPTYLFVNIEKSQRSKVLQSPGVIHIVGSGRQDASIAVSEIEFLRSSVQGRSVEPYRELVVGKTVRIKRGSLEGVEGVLVRKGNGLRFVLNIKLINQFAAIEVGAEDLEKIAS
jgi:transcription antitermination factor NusG